MAGRISDGIRYLFQCVILPLATNFCGSDRHKSLITVAANVSGGVTAKMISPQSIAIGAAAVGLVGKESHIFMFTVKHSFIMLFIISLFTTLQAYVIKWSIPKYSLTENTIPATVANLASGRFYLAILSIAIVLVGFVVFYMNRKNASELLSGNKYNE